MGPVECWVALDDEDGRWVLSVVDEQLSWDAGTGLSQCWQWSLLVRSISLSCSMQKKIPAGSGHAFFLQRVLPCGRFLPTELLKYMRGFMVTGKLL